MAIAAYSLLFFKFLYAFFVDEPRLFVLKNFPQSAYDCFYMHNAVKVFLFPLFYIFNKLVAYTEVFSDSGSLI
jgi:hypothetical protein